jgi:hypothetical protein
MLADATAEDGVFGAAGVDTCWGNAATLRGSARAERRQCSETGAAGKFCPIPTFPRYSQARSHLIPTS